MEESPVRQKRHKKHKKHKKKKQEYDSDAIDVCAESIEPSTSKEETAADLLKSQNVPVASITSSSQFQLSPVAEKEKKKKKTKGKDSGTSSDEERWLDAIESGKLEEVDDELKKIKDPKLMTARQRAMYDRGTDKEPNPGTEILMALPSGYKEKVMTAEAIQKALVKSQKRKQMADEKREKDKKKTMERLLKKQDSKIGKNSKNRPAKCFVPVISYRNTIDGGSVTMPIHMSFPLKAQTEKLPPKPVICGMPDCSNIKKYSCSKTNVPLCSFRCYKQNVAAIRNIIC